MMKKRIFRTALAVMLTFLTVITTGSYENIAQGYVQTSLNTPTVKNMIANATLPIGKAVYVYGGAWNEADTAAGTEALSYGVSPQWESFYNSQTSSYNYKNTRYQIHNGLDCTGYVGWTMYQIFGKSYSNAGYVYQSKTMAKKYSEIFGGTYIDKSNCLTCTGAL